MQPGFGKGQASAPSGHVIQVSVCRRFTSGSAHLRMQYTPAPEWTAPERYLYHRMFDPSVVYRKCDPALTYSIFVSGKDSHELHFANLKSILKAILGLHY